MNVPISVSALGLSDVETIVVFVDRKPDPQGARIPAAGHARQPWPALQAPRGQPGGAARTKDGTSAARGSTRRAAAVPCPAPREKDGSWTQTLGQARGRLFASSPVGGENASRLCVMVMHPMDTGSAASRLYVNRLAVRDEQGCELLRPATFEPVSENPVFSFDFPGRVAGGLRLTGTDNNGNRIDGRIE